MLHRSVSQSHFMNNETYIDGLESPTRTLSFPESPPGLMRNTYAGRFSSTDSEHDYRRASRHLNFTNYMNYTVCEMDLLSNTKESLNHLHLHSCSVESECPICFEDTVSDTNGGCLPCGHTFHTKCIRKWFETVDDNHFTCPCCRGIIDLETITTPKN